MPRRERGGNGRNGSKWIRPERRLAIYHRDGFACVYCGSYASLSLDHVVPRSRGGGNESSNLVTSCVPCNARRQSKDKFTPEMWERITAAQRRPVDLAIGKALRANRGTFLGVGTRSDQTQEEQWDTTTEQK